MISNGDIVDFVFGSAIEIRLDHDMRFCACRHSDCRVIAVRPDSIRRIKVHVGPLKSPNSYSTCYIESSYGVTDYGARLVMSIAFAFRYRESNASLQMLRLAPVRPLEYSLFEPVQFWRKSCTQTPLACFVANMYREIRRT